MWAVCVQCRQGPEGVNLLEGLGLEVRRLAEAVTAALARGYGFRVQDTLINKLWGSFHLMSAEWISIAASSPEPARRIRSAYGVSGFSCACKTITTGPEASTLSPKCRVDSGCSWLRRDSSKAFSPTGTGQATLLKVRSGTTKTVRFPGILLASEQADCKRQLLQTESGCIGHQPLNLRHKVLFAAQNCKGLSNTAGSHQKIGRL